MARAEATVIIAAAMPPPVHGQSVVTAAVLEELRARQVAVEVLDLSPASLMRSFAYHARRTSRTLRAIAKILSKGGGATLYTVLEARSGIVYNFAIIAAARLKNARIFIHHHTAAHLTQRRRRIRVLFRLAAAKSTHVVLSEGMMRDLQALYGVSNVLISHNAKFAGCSQQRAPRAAPVRLGLLSNLSVEKGLDLAIDTVIRGREEGLPLSLVIAGPTADAEAEAHIKRAASLLGEALDYRGAVQGSAKQAFFDDIDVFLFPTRYRNEAQPLVVLEALSRGIPCLARDQGYVGELVSGAGTTISSEVAYTEAALVYLHSWTQSSKRFRAAQSLAWKRFASLLDSSTLEFESLIGRLTDASKLG